MTKNNTKKALLMSTLSMLLCLSMLIGSTFAWFTDSASTAVNKIQSGTLDVVLEVSYDGGTTWQDAEGQTLQFKTADNRTDNILWEPGCTYELPLLRVRNEGNLGLKYQLAITGIDGDAKLNDAIEWTYIVENAEAELGEMKALNEWQSLSPKNGESDTSDAFTIKGHMKEEAGNEYQNLTIDGIGITVFATQLDMEQDSIGPDYDADAPTLIMIEDETYKTLAEAIAAAENGDVIELAGTFTLPTDGSLKNKKLTFKGIKDNITVIDLKGVHTGQSTSGAELTFEDVDVVFDNTANYKGIAHAAKIAYKNCTLYGKQFMYAPVAEFTNCEFINYTDYAVWTYGATAATFTDCTFTTGGKAVLVYTEGKINANHTFTNCTFNSNGQIATDKAAIEVGSSPNSAETTYTININNCTENGFAANKSSSALYGNKNSMDADHLKVYINGQPVNVTPPAAVTPGTVEELQAAFAAAAQQATGDIVINLTQNFDIKGAWTAVAPEGYNGVNNVIINGNGHTIYGLNDTLMVGSFGGYGSITINDLTISGAQISRAGFNGMGLGAFVAYADATGSITLNNCHLVDSKVECTDKYAGGLVGYSSSSISIKNCSVTGSTIIGGNSSGAIAGQFAASATVSNCEVTNTSVSYAHGDEVNTDGWRVGIIVGTANVGTVTMTDITESGNTLAQGTVVAPEHSNLYGRSLGDGITLDGEAI